MPSGGREAQRAAIRDARKSVPTLRAALEDGRPKVGMAVMLGVFVLLALRFRAVSGRPLRRV